MKLKLPKLKLRIKVAEKWLHRVHEGHEGVHLIYFALVFFESGHIYGIAAGLLLLLSVLEIVFDGEA